MTPHLHQKSPRSLFFYLVSIIILMALLINFIVFIFFHILRKDTIQHPLKIHLEQYAGYLVHEIGEPPNASKVKELEKILHIKIQYKPIAGKIIKLGDESIWRHGHFIRTYHGEHGVFTFVLQAPDVYNNIPRRVTILIIVLSFIFLFSWGILKKLLWPLRQFEDAYAEVGRGNLDLRLHIKHPRELVRMGEGFNSMLDNIRKILNGRQQMLRDISHELRTPLTRIKLNLSFINKTRERQDIEDDIRFMEKLIDEILDTYRYSGNEMQLRKEQIDIAKLLQKLKRTFQYSVDENDSKDTNRKIIICKPEQALIIQADKNQMIRLFSNLLANSIKYGNADKPIYINIIKNSNDFVFEISDGGKQILEEYVEKIFEPFFQIEADRNPARSGYGLGLYICRRIAEEHGGSINYEFRAESGSAFRIRLPAGKF